MMGRASRASSSRSIMIPGVACSSTLPPTEQASQIGHGIRSTPSERVAVHACLPGGARQYLVGSVVMPRAVNY